MDIRNRLKSLNISHESVETPTTPTTPNFYCKEDGCTHEKGFFTIRGLQGHMKTIHQLEKTREQLTATSAATPQAPPLTTPSAQAQKYVCKVEGCTHRRGFNSLHSLEMHMQSIHQTAENNGKQKAVAAAIAANPSISTPVMPPPQATGSSLTELSVTPSTTQPFECNVEGCTHQSGFKTRSGLQKHMKIIHSTEGKGEQSVTAASASAASVQVSESSSGRRNEEQQAAVIPAFAAFSHRLLSPVQVVNAPSVETLTPAKKETFHCTVDGCTAGPFQTSSGLHRHSKNAHPIGSNNKEQLRPSDTGNAVPNVLPTKLLNESAATPSSGTVFQCTVDGCTHSKGFQSRSGLQKHMKTIHQSGQNSRIQQGASADIPLIPTPARLPTNGADTSSIDSPAATPKAHKIKCEVEGCTHERGFQTTRGLEMHIESIHQIVKNRKKSVSSSLAVMASSAESSVATAPDAQSPETMEDQQVESLGNEADVKEPARKSLRRGNIEKPVPVAKKQKVSENSLEQKTAETVDAKITTRSPGKPAAPEHDSVAEPEKTVSTEEHEFESETNQANTKELRDLRRRKLLFQWKLTRIQEGNLIKNKPNDVTAMETNDLPSVEKTSFKSPAHPIEQEETDSDAEEDVKNKEEPPMIDTVSEDEGDWESKPINDEEWEDILRDMSNSTENPVSSSSETIKRPVETFMFKPYIVRADNTKDYNLGRYDPISRRAAPPPCSSDPDYHEEGLAPPPRHFDSEDDQDSAHSARNVDSDDEEKEIEMNPPQWVFSVGEMAKKLVKQLRKKTIPTKLNEKFCVACLDYKQKSGECSRVHDQNDDRIQKHWEEQYPFRASFNKDIVLSDLLMIAELAPPKPTKDDEGQPQKSQFVFDRRMIQRTRDLERGYVYTGMAAMLTPLNCVMMPLDESDDEFDRALITSAPSTSTAPLQKTTIFSKTNQQVNAPVGPMEGHSSLASYPLHHSSQIQQHPEAYHHQGPQPGGHPYYQQHHYGQPGSSGGDGGGQNQHMMYGNEYDQLNQASTSSAPPVVPEHHHPQNIQQHQYQQQQQYDQQTVRYNHQLPSPHSAPPQQRTFVPRYPVQVVDAHQVYGQVNRTVNAPPPVVTKPLPPPAPPPSAPPVMAPRKTPPSSFMKRQPDAEEQQRVDYEVARNVSQIMSKNGMRVTQEPIMASPPRQLPPLAPLPPTKGAGFQCPTCNRNLANARNLQRHRQTCGTTMISSSPLPHQHQQQITPQAAPQLAAMLQRSPPAPSVSAPPQQHQTPDPSASSSSFQHHNSSGDLGLGLNQMQQNALYSPQDMMMRDPNAMLSDVSSFAFKDDPMLYQGPSGSGEIWPRDDSFTQSEPHSASHDHLDLSDPLLMSDPLHNLGSFEGLSDDNHRESTRECMDTDDLTTLDPTPHCSTNFFGIDPELEMPLVLDVDEPIIRSESASLSSSSHGRNTPANPFMCEACKKVVSSDRSLRRHYSTCKALSETAPEDRPAGAKRKAATGVKRGKKTKISSEEDSHEAPAPEKNSAILAALRKEPVNPYQPNFSSMMLAPLPGNSNQFQAPMKGASLPPLSTSWLSGNSSSVPSTRATSQSSGMFTPPMAASTPIPYQQKSNPLEELLMEDEPPEEDGDSRSSSGATPVAAPAKPNGHPMFSCEYCTKKLCSMSNLKRHRSTCKKAAGPSVSNSPSKPATPAPSVAPAAPPPQQTPSQAPAAPAPVSLHLSLETNAVVTYTKTNTGSSTNTWSSDKAQLVSPKQKIQSSNVLVTHTDSSDISASSSTASGKNYMTVGEALRAKQQQQRMANLDQQQQQQQMFQQQQQQQHQRFQQGNQLHHMPARIPPRPPNPILNQIQNPPQQVQQNQMQNQMQHQQQGNVNQMNSQSQPQALQNQNAPVQHQQHVPQPQMHQQPQQQSVQSQMQPAQKQQLQHGQLAPNSRQAPQSEHQIVHQQLPPLSSAELHSQLQLQSPPQKKGLIEHRNNDQVLITSEPLPVNERRNTYQGPQHPSAQLQPPPQQQQQTSNAPRLPPMYQAPIGRQFSAPQELAEQKRRSSDGQVLQSQPKPPMVLPPLHLPQRQRPQQQNPPQQSQPQTQQQPQPQVYQVQFNGRPMPPMQFPSLLHQNNNNQQQQAMRMQMQQGQQEMQQNQMEHIPPQQQPPMNQMQMHHQMNQQHQMYHPQNVQQNQGQQNQLHMSMQQQHHLNTQQQHFPPMHHQHQFHQQPQNMQMQQLQHQNPSNSQPQIQKQHQQPMPQMMPIEQAPMQQQQQRPAQTETPQAPLPPQQQMGPVAQVPAQETELKPPPAKRGRSQSTAMRPHMDPPIATIDVPQRQPGSPLDSIITTAPLSVEVHHKPPSGVPEQGLSSVDSQSTAPSPGGQVVFERSTGSKKANQQAYICPECDRIYSCRKNVKRHRMAVHKMTLNEVLAKPENPAPEGAEPSAVSGRRHTVAGTDNEKASASSKNGGAKRKGSAATTTSKKGKEKEKVLPIVEQSAEKPTIPEESTDESVLSRKSSALPSVEPLLRTSRRETTSPMEAPIVPTQMTPSQQADQEQGAFQSSGLALNQMQDSIMMLSPQKPAPPLRMQALPPLHLPRQRQEAFELRPPPEHNYRDHLEAPPMDNQRPADTQVTYQTARPDPEVSPPAPAPAQFFPWAPVSANDSGIPLNQALRSACLTTGKISSSMSLPLPPLHLPPLQDLVTSNDSPLSMPNSAPLTSSSSAISSTLQSRNSEFTEEKDMTAMAKIVEELKRSSDGWRPGSRASKGIENGEELDEDEILIRNIRRDAVQKSTVQDDAVQPVQINAVHDDPVQNDTAQDDALQDDDAVSDISDLFEGHEEDSMMFDEVMQSVMRQPCLPPLSTSSSAGLPSLSSPEEDGQQQQPPPEYHQFDQMEMWNEENQNYPQEQFHHQESMRNEEMMLYHHEQMLLQQYPLHEMREMSFLSVEEGLSYQDALFLPRSDSRPGVPRMRAGRRPQQKAPVNLMCSGCKKILATEYSLRRHRAGCVNVQQALNPEYPKPPQRRADTRDDPIRPRPRKRKAAKHAELMNEVAVLKKIGIDMPLPIIQEEKPEPKFMTAAEELAHLEALPPPSAVFELVADLQKDAKKKRETTSPSPGAEAPDHDFDVPISASATSASSSSSSTPTTEKGIPSSAKIQARHVCQPCKKYYSSEWNLERHRRGVCPASTNYSY
ncbi:unnamed protein product [Caenorhabditis sp. 36 PRJEB53466]|nr:unnamed protein product [Caenorhabditis sp. 36 PRJEB53466]